MIQKKKKTVTVVILIVFLLCALLLVFVLWRHKTKNTTKNNSKVATSCITEKSEAEFTQMVGGSYDASAIDRIESADDFSVQPDCLYLALNYSIQTKNTTKAVSTLGILESVIKSGIEPKFFIMDTSTVESLKFQVNSLTLKKIEENALPALPEAPQDE